LSPDHIQRAKALLAEFEAGELPSLDVQRGMAGLLQELVDEQPSAVARNTPIDQLLEQYTLENCDFTDMEWVRQVAQRNVATMPDSQVRCLLFVLSAPPSPRQTATTDSHQNIQHQRELAVAKSLVDALATLCAGSSDKVIDSLTGYLWDQSEADAIKIAKPFTI
jgi:hypothetical protein